MGAELQDFIAAHGYQIEPIWLPFRSKDLRQNILLNWMKKNKSKSFHFFLAYDTWLEFQKPLEELFHPYSTFTLINPKNVSPQSNLEEFKFHTFNVDQKPTPFLYELHEIFCKVMGTKALRYDETLLDQDPILFDRFLDHCVHLAENEYKDLTSRM